jgi:hypothetical protein
MSTLIYHLTFLKGQHEKISGEPHTHCSPQIPLMENGLEWMIPAFDEILI